MGFTMNGFLIHGLAIDVMDGRGRKSDNGKRTREHRAPRTEDGGRRTEDGITDFQTS